MRKLLLLAALLFIAPKLTAQIPSFPHDEEAIGVAGNLFLRGPWVAQGIWRTPVVRFVTFNATSVLYEEYLDKNKWDATDVRQRFYAFVATEVIVDVGTWGFHKIFPSHPKAQ